MSLPIETTIIKPRSWFFLIILLLLLGIYLWAQNKPDATDASTIMGITAIIIGLIWYFISRISITIDNEGLTYKTPFSNKYFLWRDITRTYLKFRHNGKSKQLHWYFEEWERSWNMSIGFYSRKDLRKIAEAVTTKCQKAEIDPRILNMAEGRFPWYIF